MRWTNYKKKHPNVVIRPYDIRNRDVYYYQNDFYARQTEFQNTLRIKYNIDSLSIENYIILSYYLKLEEIDELMTQADIAALNSTTFDDIIRNSFEWKAKNLIKLVRSTPSLGKFESHIMFEYTFWKQRNDAMLKNILKFTSIYRNKKILIVTGAYHRYYLKAGLEKQMKDFGFKLTDGIPK